MNNNKTLALKKRELGILSGFIESEIDCRLADGIYALPWIDPYSDSPILRVVVIKNVDLNYQEQVYLSSERRNLVSKDNARVKNIVSAVNTMALRNDANLSFEERTAYDYNTKYYRTIEKELARDLVSSYILFDRFGTYKTLRETHLEKGVTPHQKLPKLSNITDLMALAHPSLSTDDICPKRRNLTPENKRKR